jgi:hypothetical protein
MSVRVKATAGNEFRELVRAFEKQDGESARIERRKNKRDGVSSPAPRTGRRRRTPPK